MSYYKKRVLYKYAYLSLAIKMYRLVSLQLQHFGSYKNQNRCQKTQNIPKYVCGWDCDQDPMEGAYSAPPDSLAGLNGLLRGGKWKAG